MPPYLAARKTTGQYVLLTAISRRGRRQSRGSIYGATKFFIHGFDLATLADEMAEWARALHASVSRP